MGTGDFICISMTGGAPWGFRLQGGKEQKQPLQVAKIRSQSKASGAGLCEGDEVVSINGSACADLTYPEVIQLMESITDSLQMLIKRPTSGASEALVSKPENQALEHLTLEGHVESTSLQIPPATWPQRREQNGAPAAADGGAVARGRTVELRLSLRPSQEPPSLPPTTGIGGGQQPQAQSPGPSQVPSGSPFPDPIPKSSCSVMMLAEVSLTDKAMCRSSGYTIRSCARLRWAVQRAARLLDTAQSPGRAQEE
ncbi:synaptopodin-2 [Marmota marmota marmota]|uniref:synaptopodin-2 n=1 Tax=Marmota marmota marmota TaxID=9994 RepID=UPI002092BC86|nr:synaptopodin-2 [Marmota marmota marmota]